MTLFPLFSFASATPTPAPFVDSLDQDPNTLIKFKDRVGGDFATKQMIDQQSKTRDSGDHSTITRQKDLDAGQARAEQMVEALKSEELQRAFGQVTAVGNKRLEENPELKNPVAIVAGAFALWAGNTIRLVKKENFKLFSKIEGRNRSGEFRMESPLLNGKLNYNTNEGLQLNMSRQLKPIDSSAALTYNAKTQFVGGQLSHHLMDNVDLSVGSFQSTVTNQKDEQAKIEYRLSF